MVSLQIISALNVQAILIGCIVVLIVYRVTKKQKYKLPPGPWGLPIIGNIEMVKERFIFLKCTELAKKYGPVFTVHLGPFRVVVLNDINVVTEALIKKKGDFAGRPHIPSVHKLTDGGRDIAFANYSPTWKLHRKIAGKALRHYLAGSHLEEVVHSSMTKCLAKMSEETGPFDPEPYIDLIVFNILDAVCFGESCNLDDPEFQQFMKLEKDTTQVLGKGLIEDVFPFLANIWPTQKYTKVMRMSEERISMIRKKFKEHEESFDPDNIRDFTDSLLLARQEAEADEDTELLSKLTETHLIQTLADIFSGGISTSRITLYFAVRYMADLQDVQSKVQEELDRVVGRNRLPRVKDRENLSYCEATLHEMMRLSSAAPMGVPHSTLCDTHINGYDIPKDTMVLINHWALHHDPNYWKDVDKFDPTRFMDSNGKLGMKPESWLPFSAGRRVCLGETVAKPELHLIFSSIIQRFQITLSEDSNPKFQLAGSGTIMQPEPFKIVIKERT